MADNFFRKLSRLSLEEKILNSASLLALIGVFSPWIAGEWLGGETVSFTGLGFYTSFMGITVLFLHLFLLLITIIPLTGGPSLVRKQHKEIIRLFVSVQAAVLVIAGLSVLTKFTLEFSRMEIRFGVYLSLVGSLIAALYAFLIKKEEEKNEVYDLFHHHEDNGSRQRLRSQAEADETLRQTSIAPPASEPEEHRLHR